MLFHLRAPSLLCRLVRRQLSGDVNLNVHGAFDSFMANGYRQAENQDTRMGIGTQSRRARLRHMAGAAGRPNLSEYRTTEGAADENRHRRSAHTKCARNSDTSTHTYDETRWR